MLPFMHHIETKLVKYIIRTFFDENPDTGQKEVFLQLWGGGAVRNRYLGNFCTRPASAALTSYHFLSLL